MTLQRFILNHELATNATAVYDSLADMRTFGSLHPYMYSVELVDNAQDSKEYKIKEEVYFFGFIKNHPVYNARVFEIEKGKHIRYTSQVKSFILLTIDFTFVKNESGLIVNECLTLECNKLIALVFYRILKKSHLMVFDNLRKINR